jgi:hypothetical protein
VRAGVGRLIRRSLPGRLVLAAERAVQPTLCGLAEGQQQKRQHRMISLQSINAASIYFGCRPSM